MNVDKTVVTQVVPQLDNSPTDEGAWLVLKLTAYLKVNPAPSAFSAFAYRAQMG